MTAADEGITGTKAARPKFQQMLEDAKAGKIDMIISKSISRFARNTVTLLEAVRELKAIGVDVYFEEQNIHTMSGDGELMLTILASFAQEESKSVSDNCKWRIKKGFEKGISSGWNVLYGYRIEKKVITVNEKEAAVVRWVFREYLSGKGVCAIARTMRQNNVKSFRGGIWTHKRVTEILKNEKYAGDMLLQKKFVSDHLTKALRRNYGELPQYYVEGSHPAIVSREDFEKVQRIMRDNALVNGIRREDIRYYTFTRKIICDQCGKRYRRKISKTENAWNCATYLGFGKAHCHTKQIPEDILMQTTAAVLGLDEFDEDVFEEQIEEIHVPAFNQLVFYFKDGHREERSWTDKSRSASWTPEMRRQAAEKNRRRSAI